MFEESAAAIDRFRGLKALVLGDLMLDSYFSGPSHRLCPEAPVPIVDIAHRVNMPGGAANCALNLTQLGAQASLMGVFGGDCEGELLRSLLTDAGVAPENLVRDGGRSTLFKARILCDGHMVVRFDQGATGSINSECERALIEKLSAAYASADLVVISDYGYGVLTPAVIERIAQLQKASPKLLVVDSKNLAAYRHVGMTLCKPNYQETVKLLGRSPTCLPDRRCEALITEGQRILQLTGSRIVAVTLDRDGALIFKADRLAHRTFTRSAPNKQAAGAGDTYLSAFGLALAAGVETFEAAELAAAAAAVVVGKEHTATCSAAELKQQLEGGQWPRCSLKSLRPVLEQYRRHDRRIVLTNGCFDILHRGHIAYLEQARRLGDVLVVGVNTDESIRRLKGQSRPINCLADRMGVLAALSCVDHVVPFGEDTPHRLIEAVRPNVFVKGGDYTRATLPEADLVERLGGTVKILPLVSDRSTTNIIDRIRQAYGNPGEHPQAAQEGEERVAPVVRSAAAAVRSA